MSRILITIPTWNEAVIIERNLKILQEAVLEYLPHHEVVIEVADNGSTDGTGWMVKNVQFTIYNLQFFELEEKGKGLAIRRSWARHLDDADVLVFTDADLAADLSALPALVRPIMDDTADIVCGSRFIKGAKKQRIWYREAASVLYRFLQRLILHLPVQDAQCGFKAISQSAARELLPLCRETGWMFDSELLALAAAKEKRVVEIPVQWIEHRHPARRSAIQIWRHGWGFLSGLIRIRKAVEDGI
ncbi:glycosyltransferase [Patescibacteria group bacterium]|nr:glycosyltransferase [Patescibacteria group bacterium]